MSVKEILGDVAGNILSWVIIGLLTVVGYVTIDLRGNVMIMAVNQKQALEKIENNTRRLDVRTDFINDTGKRLERLETRLDYMFFEKK